MSYAGRIVLFLQFHVSCLGSIYCVSWGILSCLMIILLTMIGRSVAINMYALCLHNCYVAIYSQVDLSLSYH